ATNVVDGMTSLISGAFAIFEQEVDTSKLTVRLNGVEQGSVSLAGAASGANKRVYLGSRDGATWFFSGYVRALLVYEGNATSVQKDRIRNYLVSRYRIPIPYPIPPVPNAPSNLTANDEVADVRLDWLDNSTDESGFHVYRNDEMVADLPADSTF